MSFDQGWVDDAREPTLAREMLSRAHAAARGEIPPASVVGGEPCRIFKNRRDIDDDPPEVEPRRYLAAIATELDEAVSEDR